MRLFYLSFMCLFFCLSGEETEILFHLNDAGETNALLPVIEKLEVDYLVVCTGTSQNLVKSIPKERMRSFSEISSIHPHLVVTGVSTHLQAETIWKFKEKGVKTYAFWDNFNADGELPYFKVAKWVASQADVLLLPSKTLLSSFPGMQTKVVGHPTLDVFLPEKVILWIGGYGKEYEEAFSLFQEGMKKVPNALVIYRHHPKTGEKNAFTLLESLKLAELVVCHQSTVSFQALKMGKKVLHVIPEGQNFDSLPLQKGLAKKVKNVEDFAKAVDEAMEVDVSLFSDLMGIPKDSTQVFKESLLEALH